MAAARIVVDLTLLNVASDVLADDDMASMLVEQIQESLLSDAIDAENRWVGTASTLKETECIKDQVLRFLQTKDKYAAVVSVLLKSRAFYHVFESMQPEEYVVERRIVVGLPRTKHKKPYIPVPHELVSMKVSEEDLWPLSVSHQHPFVGIAHFREHVNQNRERPLLLGLDIVVFEGYNPRLYADEDEFLDVFRDYFTTREWSMIQSNRNGRLQEFYIRWSMKEAYTKALGMGMGLDFSALDLVLQADRDDTGTGVIDSLRGDNALFQSVVVNYMKEGRKSGERWEFAFLPLRDESGRGCACVCVGPLHEKSSAAPSFDLTIQWMTLQALIHWHQVQPIIP